MTVLFKKEKDMKNARMLLVAALIVGVGHLASGHEPSARGKEQQRKRDQVHIAVQAIPWMKEQGWRSG